MTNARRVMHAHMDRLASEPYRPFAALLKAIFIAFMVFTWVMGLMLGVVPIFNGLMHGFIAHVIEPVGMWVASMGREGFITMLSAQIALTIFVVFLTRNYLKLALQGLVAGLAELRALIEGRMPKPKRVLNNEPRTD